MQGLGGGVKINVSMELSTFLNASQEEVQTSQWGMPKYWSLIMLAFYKAYVYTHAGHAHTYNQLMYVWPYINWYVMRAKLWQIPACLCNFSPATELENPQRHRNTALTVKIKTV